MGKDDEGLYLCEADNGLEPSLAKVLCLIVRQPAQIIDELRLLGPSAAAAAAASDSASGQTLISPPGSPVIRSVRLQQTPATNPLNATSQQQLRVLCQPSGDLPLTVDWLKDDQLIYTHTILSGETSITDHHQQQQSQHQHQHQPQQLARWHVNTRRSGISTRPHQQQQQPNFESELYMTGLRRSDAGLFVCLARNAYGRSERRMNLVLQEQPDPPEVVDVGHIGSRAIGLRWLPSAFDGNSPILKYIVEYRRLVSSSATLHAGESLFILSNSTIQAKCVSPPFVCHWITKLFVVVIFPSQQTRNSSNCSKRTAGRWTRTNKRRRTTSRQRAILSLANRSGSCSSRPIQRRISSSRFFILCTT